MEIHKENHAREAALKEIVIKKLNYTLVTIQDELVQQNHEGECGIARRRPKRIIGGQDAAIGEWPWMAVLYHTRNRVHFCGGALISTNWVVTAATCINVSRVNESTLTVYLGKHDLDIVKSGINVDEIIVHPDYNLAFDADIALIRLTEHVVFTEKIKPVCLPSVEKAEQLLQPNTYGTVLGWGDTGEQRQFDTRNILQE
ncbi:serine protease 48-like, partial [Saccoglossus kowalevskii]